MPIKMHTTTSFSASTAVAWVRFRGAYRSLRHTYDRRLEDTRCEHLWPTVTSDDDNRWTRKKKKSISVLWHTPIIYRVRLFLFLSFSLSFAMSRSDLCAFSRCSHPLPSSHSLFLSSTVCARSRSPHIDTCVLSLRLVCHCRLCLLLSFDKRIDVISRVSERLSVLYRLVRCKWDYVPTTAIQIITQLKSHSLSFASS